MNVGKAAHWMVHTLDGKGLAIYVSEDNLIYLKDSNGNIQLLTDYIKNLEIPEGGFQSGSSGTSGINYGSSGSSGKSGLHGTSGFSGTSGIDGVSLHGSSGSSGTSALNGSSGTSGNNGSSGSSGISGSSGTSATCGTSGVNGVVGASGKDGVNGTSGINGQSGINGFDGTSGINGFDGTSGTSGRDATSGTSGKGYSFSQIQTKPKTIINFTENQILSLYLKENTTLKFVDFPIGIFYLIVEQGVGSYEVTFPYEVKQSQGMLYTPTERQNAKDVLQFMCDGQAYYIIDYKKDY